MTTREIPLGKLDLSPENMRQGDVPVADLVASIGAYDPPRVLQNLRVTVQTNASGKPNGRFDVHVGGRRLRALFALVASKRITKAFPVTCAVCADSDEALEESVAENLQRMPLHPVQQFMAFKKLIDKGRTVDQVADRFDITPRTVRQRLKLANLSPRLLALCEADDISVEQMAALSVSDDHVAQEEAWFDAQDWQRDPHSLKARLTVNEVNIAKDRRGRFIGAAAFEAAGGVIRRDLFSDNDAGYVHDIGLLDRLTAQALQVVADEVAAEGFAWVEVRSSFDYSESSAFERAYPVTQLTDDVQAKVDALEDRYRAFEITPEADTDDGVVALEAIEAEIADLQAGASSAYDPAVAGYVGAVVYLQQSGEPQIVRGLIRPEDAKALSKPEEGQDDGDDVDVADPAAQRSTGLSAALVESLTAQRTLAIRATLAQRPDVALRATVHTLLTTTHYGARGGLDTALTISGSDHRSDPMRYGAELKEAPAHQAHAALQGRMTMWLPERDQLWDFLAERSQDELLELLAYAASCSVYAVQHAFDKPTGARLTNADQIAQALDLDMADWWTPTAETYLGRVSKGVILNAVGDGCGEDFKLQCAGMKKGDLVRTAQTALADKRWVPAILKPMPSVEADMEQAEDIVLDKAA